MVVLGDSAQLGVVKRPGHGLAEDAVGTRHARAQDVHVDVEVQRVLSLKVDCKLVVRRAHDGDGTIGCVVLVDGGGRGKVDNDVIAARGHGLARVDCRLEDHAVDGSTEEGEVGMDGSDAHALLGCMTGLCE